MSIYFDYSATTPVDPDVAKLVVKLMTTEFGNASSGTHQWGKKANQYVEQARKTISRALNSNVNDVFFTSGATESNNIAILGLLEFAQKSNKKHIITTAVEHKSVIEPFNYLKNNFNFDVTILNPDAHGFIAPEKLEKSLKRDTLLVSTMHVNNETGCIFPIEKYCEVLRDSDAFFHVDASQSFGKYTDILRNARIDMVSISGHKIFAPKGVGALALKRRMYKLPPLQSIMKGGSQERGLRPGTLAVPLIAGFGKAFEMAESEKDNRLSHVKKIRAIVETELASLGAIVNGKNLSDYNVNFYIEGLKNEVILRRLKDVASFSVGSACNSKSEIESHVLKAMGMSEGSIGCSIRISWSHMTKLEDVQQMLSELAKCVSDFKGQLIV